MIMKKICGLITFLILSSASTYGQGTVYNTESTDSLNVYSKSLNEFSKYTRHVFPKVKNVYLEKSALTTWFPKELRGIKLILVSEADLKALFRKNKNIYFTRVVPMRAKGDIFFINIIPFRVEFNKTELNLINSGAIQTKFKYECNSGTFTFIDVEGGFSELQ
jgi:hypothetical protein